MFDVMELMTHAEKALDAPAAIRTVGGWPTLRIEGKTWEAAEFPFDGQNWAAVRGAQRPSSAQLLGVAAAYRNHVNATNVIAIIGSDGKHERAPGSFRRRYQAAVWQALGVVWVEKDEPSWEPGARIERGDFDTLAKACDEELRASVEREPHTWRALLDGGHSPPAEKHVRDALDVALARLGFAKEDRKQRQFKGFWRSAKTDGCWVRAGDPSPSLALEVKVGEDKRAPLCQALDDVAAFGAVIYVRLVGKSDATAIPANIRNAMSRAEARLPVRYLELRI